MRRRLLAAVLCTILGGLYPWAAVAAQGGGGLGGATEVSGLTVTPSTTATGAIADYTIDFTTSASGALSAGDAIVVTFSPAVTVSGSTYAVTAGGPVTVTGATYASGSSVQLTLTLAAGQSIAARNAVQVSLQNVVNPAAPGTENVTVNTTADVGPAMVAFTIGGGGGGPGSPPAGTSVQNVAVASTTYAAGATADYTVDFSVYSALSAGGTIQLTAPGTTFPAQAGAYTINDLTNPPAGGQVSSPPSLASGSSTFAVPNAIGAGDRLWVAVSGVTNPTLAVAGETLAVATAADVLPTSSAPYAIVPGPPSKVSFIWQPSGGSPGTPWATQPVAAVEDSLSNVVTTATNDLSLAIGTDPGAGSLTCTATTAAAVYGVVYWRGCRIDKAGTGYTLVASTPGLSDATSAAFNITAGTLPDLTVTSASAPASATAGQAATVSWAVYNGGTGSASGSWSDAVYLSATPTLGAGANPLLTVSESVYSPLAAGAAYRDSRAVTLPTVPTGGYDLIFQTNSTGSLTESNSGNNTFEVPITVAAPVASGSLYAVGGTGANGVTGTMSQYVVGDNCWTGECPFSGVPPAPTARTGLAAVFNPGDGRLYALGGADGSGRALGTVEAFLLLQNCWTDNCAGSALALPSMPTPRYGLAAVRDASTGLIYAIGGAATGGASLDAVEAYNPGTGAWATLAPLSTPRHGLAAVVGPDGRIYAIGGSGASGIVGTVEAYDPGTGAWATDAALPTPRTGLAAVVGPDGRIYAIGGTGANGIVGTVEAYDPATGLWSSRAAMPTARTDLAAVVGGDGRIYAIGGKDAGGNPLAAVEAYTPAANSWTAVAALPLAAYGLAATAVPSVSGVSVSPSVATAGSSAQYTVTFTATSGLSVSQAVYLVAPTGTVFPSSSPSAYSVNGVQAAAVSASGEFANLTVPSGVPVAAGGSVTLTIAGVTNPGAVNSGDTVQVSTSADPAPAPSAPYAITAGVAATLSFAHQPGDGTVGQPLGNQPQVAVEDAAGNPVRSNAVVTLSIANPNGAKLTCASNSVTAVNGLAVFSGCSMDKAANGYFLTASATGLSNATSAGFNVTGSADGTGTMSVQPSSAVAGSTGNTLTFTYTAAAGGISNGEVETLVPIGWTPPSTVAGVAGLTTASTGTVGVQGQSITVTGLILAGGGTLTLTYGFGGGATGVTAPNTTGTATFTTSEESSATGSLTPLASPPSLTMNATAATASLAVTAPGSATAGAPFSVTITAKDQNGNTVTGYAGTVHVASSDGLAGLPANYTFTPGDGGSHTFTGVMLATAGSQSVTATDTTTPDITGTTFVRVSAAAVSQLALTIFSAQQTVGGQFGLIVAAQDPYGNIVPSYAGTVHFTTTDAVSAGGQAPVLPQDYTFTGGDAGEHTFGGIILYMAGTATVSATDKTTASVTGSTPTITVGAASATQLSVTAPASASAGTAFSITVTATDSYGNTATGYSGTVRLSTSDGNGPNGVAPALPGTYTFTGTDNGIHTFAGLILYKAGTATVLATDNASITGTSGAINVTAGAATELVFTTQPGGGAAGAAWSSQPVVTVDDASGNRVTSSTAGVALAIQTNPGNGALTCSANQITAAAGAAAFSGCSIDNAGNGYTLQATSSGITSASSSAFDVTGSTGQLTITTPTTLPDATVNQPYTQTLVATGGTGPYTWSSAQLGATGLSLSPSGTLSATAVSGPSGAIFGFQIQVQDSGRATASATFNLPVVASTVQGPTVQVSPATAFYADATYTVGFTTSVSGALSAGDTITLSAAPQGTVFSNVYTDYAVQGGSVPVTAVNVGSFTPEVTITLGGSIPASTPAVVVARDVVNPPSPSADDALSVSTSQDGQAVRSAGYAVTAIPPLPAGLAGSSVLADPTVAYYDLNNFSQTLAVAVAVYLKDGSGTPLSGRDVVLGAQFPPGAQAWSYAGPTVAVTGAGGEADFGVQCSVEYGYCTGPLTFAATDTTDGFVIPGPSVPVSGYNIEFSGGDYSGSTADVSGYGLPASQAVTLTFNGSPVTLSGSCSTDASGQLGTNDACGFTVPAGTAGSQDPVVLSAGGFQLQGRFQMGSNPAGVPSAIQATAGDGQRTAVGAPFSTGLQAKVTDAKGTGVSGVTVTFAVQASNGGAGGTFPGSGTTATAQTDGSGVATAPALTANTTAGAFTVTASAVATGMARFSLTVTAGRAASMQVLQGDQQEAVVGTAFAEPLEVKVLDAYGNLVSGAGVTFTPPVGEPGTTQAAVTTQTGSGGAADASFTANGHIGQFQVDATTLGVTAPAVFHLTNATALLSSCDPATFASAIAGTGPIWLLFPVNCTLTPPQAIVIPARAQVTLDGTGTSVNFDGGKAGRVFDVEGGTLTLIDLTVDGASFTGQDGQNGQNGGPGSSGGNVQGAPGGQGANGSAGTSGGDGEGGAMYIAPGGQVTLIDTTFASNTLSGGRGGDGGNGGNGGAGGPGGIMAATSNTVLSAADGGNGGNGGTAAPGGDGQGGAIYNAGTLTVEGGTFQGDVAYGGPGGSGGSGGAGGNGGIGMGGPKGQRGDDQTCLAGIGGGVGQPGGQGGDAGSGGVSQNGASGGNGQGGAIYNTGTLTVTGTTFAADFARGWSGGNGGGTGAWGGVGGVGGRGGDGGAGGNFVVPPGGCKKIAAGGGGGNGGPGGPSGKSGNGSFAGAGGPGGAGQGGAIFNAGTLILNGVTFGTAAAGNEALGGIGGIGGIGGNAAQGPEAGGGGGGASGCVVYKDQNGQTTGVSPPCGKPGKGGPSGYGKQYGLGRAGGDGGPGGAGEGGAIYATGGSTVTSNGVTYGANNGNVLAANLAGGGQGSTGGAGGYSKCALLATGTPACVMTSGGALGGGSVTVTGKQQPGGAAGANGPGAGSDLFAAGAANSQLMVVTDSLSGGSVGGGYWGFLQATGGTTPYTWSVVQGALSPGLSLDSTYGNLSGTATQAGTFLFTVQVQDSSTPALTATQALSITIPAQAVYQAGSTVAGSSNASSSTPQGTATAGGSGTATADTTATAQGGIGQVAVTDYSGDPGSGVSFQTTGQYFDVALSSGSTFQSVTIQKCGLRIGDTVKWSPDGVTWLPVKPQSAVDQSGCITLGPLNASSSPTLAQLGGTPFAVAASPTPLAAGDTLTFAPSPLAAAGSLSQGDSVSGAVNARTAASAPATDATVYLSLASGSAGSATAEGTALTAIPEPFTTDASGQVPIVYTAGSASSGTDVVTAAGDSTANSAISATDAYGYAAPVHPPAQVTLVASPSQAGPGAAVNVSGTIEDISGNPVLNAVVDLTASSGTLASLSVPTGPDGSYSAILTMPASGGTTLGASVEGASPPLTAMAIVTPTGVTVTGSARGSSANGSATAGGSGLTADTTATATGGTGSVNVAEYSANPGGAPTFTASGAYFDVALSPGNTFTAVTIARCGVPSGDQAYWWNGSVWNAASEQSGAGGGCVTVTVTGSTAPDLGQLTGTPFAVGVAPAASSAPVGPVIPAPTSGGAVTSTSNVGAQGGTLSTPDGAFDMVVPPGAVPSGGELWIGETTGAGPGTTVPATLPLPLPALPPHTALASPVFVLSGASLAGAAIATIRYVPATLGGLAPQRLAAYFTAGSAWQALPTFVDPVAGTVRAAVPGAGTLAVLATTAPFPDVPMGYWAAPDLEALAAMGILQGFPDGTMRPDEPVTRAQFVKMLDLTLGLTPAITTRAFADVAAGAWYAGYVAAAVQTGVAVGISPTQFEPDAPVTREQMASLLTRALGLRGGPPLPFADAADIDGWAESGVQAAVGAGYMQGFPGGTFDPTGATTRAQAAQVLARALAERAPSGGG